MAEPSGAHLQDAWAIVISIPRSRGSTFNIPGERIPSQAHPSSGEALRLIIVPHTKMLIMQPRNFLRMKRS